LLQQIRIGLVRSLNAKLVDELLAAHVEAKRNYFLGGLRLSEVEGGRFCEAAFRLLQQMAFGAFDPLGTQLDTDGLIRKLAQIPTASKPDSVRLHIPRSLRVVYDIRNKRDAAHLADGIDPNLQDASLVVAVLDWVLAEFVRLHHSVSGNEAQNMVNLISTRMAPAIEDFGGFLKVLKTGLGASEHLLLLLYQRGPTGATLAELVSWARPAMRANIRRTLGMLTDGKAFAHQDGDRFFVTRIGQRHVEANGLAESH
jgi:hypothetical protein